MNIRQIAKAIAGWFGAEAVAIGTWVGTLPEGPISARSWVMLIVALVSPLAVGFGVYQTRNAPSSTDT